MTSVAQFLVFKDTITQTLLPTPSRALWKDGRKVDFFLWGTVVSEFSQLSQSMKSIPFLVLCLVLFNQPPHRHVLPTVAQNTPYAATRDFPKQRLWLCKKVQQTFSPLFCHCSSFFEPLPIKHTLFLSHSHYISTTCFEAAVYNNPLPCHNPFKRTKEKV